MKIKKIILIPLFLFTLFNINIDSAKAENINPKDLYDSYLTLLNPYAEKVITKPYDLFNAKIISINRVTKGRTPEEKKANKGMFDFIVKVQYRTYTGAHNPPESIETLTFRVNPIEIKVIKRKTKTL